MLYRLLQRAVDIVAVFVRDIAVVWHAVTAAMNTTWGKYIGAPIAALLVMSLLTLLPLVPLRKLAYLVRVVPLSAYNLAAVCYRRALHRERRGRLDGALDDLNVAIRALDDITTRSDAATDLRIQSLDARARIYETTGRWSEAADDFAALSSQRTTVTQAYVPGWLYRLAHAKRQLGLYNEALTLEREADLLEKRGRVPANAAPSLKLWPIVEDLVLGEQINPAQLAQARAEYDALARSDPSDANAAYGRALLAVVGDDPEAARLLTNAASLLAPDFPNVYYWRARVRYRAGDLAGCLEDCTRASTATVLRGPIESLKGYALFGLGRLPDAAASFSAAVEADPTSVEAQQGLVLCRIHLAQWHEAMADADRAIAEGISDASVLAARGDAALHLGQLDEAIRNASTALASSPGTAYAFRVRGVAYHNQQRWREAVTDLASAVSIEPAHGVSYAYRAEAHRMLGEMSQAIADADEAVKSSPDVLFTRLARTLIALSRFYLNHDVALLDAADADADMMIAMQDRDALGYWAKAEVRRARNEPDETLRLVKQALARNPAFAGAYQTAGWVHISRSEWQLAAAQFELAIKYGSRADLGDSYHWLAEAQRWMGDARAAIANYDRALELAPALETDIRRGRAFALIDAGGSDAEALATLQELARSQSDAALLDWAYALSLTGRHEESIKQYSAVIERAPKLARLYEERALARAYGGQPQSALDDLSVAIELDPSSAMTLNNRGWVLAKLERWSEVVDACTRAVGMDPRLDYAFSNRSVALWRLGRRDEARRDIEELIRLRTGASTARSRAEIRGWEEDVVSWSRCIDAADPVAYLGYGVALWIVGRTEEAQRALQRALSLDPSLSAAMNLIAALTS